MLDRQRNTVHPDRQQRIPLVGEGLNRGADGEPVDRGGQHHVGVGGNPGVAQEVSHPISGPGRVGDEFAADRIGHTRQRHGLLDRLEALQIVEGVGHFLVHHAVDPQPPIGARELRHAQRGVDAIEVGVGGDETRKVHPGRGDVGRRWRRCGHRRGQGQGVAVAGYRAQAASDHRTGDPGDEAGGDETEGRQGQPPAPVDPAGRLGCVGRLVADAPGGQQAQHRDRATDPDHGRHQIGGSGAGSGQHRRATGQARRDEGQTAHGDPRAFPARRHSGQSRDHGHHHHRQEQLVGGTESLDRPLFDRSGGQVDHRRTDGGAHVGGGGEEGGQQLRHAQAHRGGGHPRTHPQTCRVPRHGKNLPPVTFGSGRGTAPTAPISGGKQCPSPSPTITANSATLLVRS